MTPAEVSAKLEEIIYWGANDPYLSATARVYVDWLTLQLQEEMRKNAEIASTNQRLADLVRYKRMELHADDLISNEEYAEIIQNPGAVNRLEGYDKVQARLAEKITRLREEVEGCQLMYKMAQEVGAVSERSRMMLEVERDRLREALEKIMIGGNHLANYLIGEFADDPIPSYQLSVESGQAIIDDPELTDLWICWRAIMQARDRCAALGKEKESA